MTQSDTPKHSYRLKHLLVMLMDAARHTHTHTHTKNPLRPVTVLS